MDPVSTTGSFLYDERGFPQEFKIDETELTLQPPSLQPRPAKGERFAKWVRWTSFSGCLDPHCCLWRPSTYWEIYEATRVIVIEGQGGLNEYNYRRDVIQASVPFALIYPGSEE